MEILHTTEFSPLKGACSDIRFHLLGQLYNNRTLDSPVTLSLLVNYYYYSAIHSKLFI